ncbi:MAG TPA: 1,2-phenylacetyl-CoA epoxidase subunit PaaA [Actinomycetota bacterium]|nr:1,2-phenylacetyl-CoA epoxidase subunit PaaA [Actinomycetota bacterium]
MQSPPIERTDTEYVDRVLAFKARIDAGEKVEAADWMPDEYRDAVLRFIEMHANSEIMGALPEREWIPRAPSLRRKLSLTSKVQDEVGHAQILYRVAEDLGKSREKMFDDLVNGRTKFHNVFHYPTRSWGDVAVIGWLIDGAALVTQKALLNCSYEPYVRAMKRICAEESLHLRHGEDLTLELVSGTPEQREMFQDAVNRWWRPIMHFFGPPSKPGKDALLYWGIKSKSNEELRDEFFSTYVPRLWDLGISVPDPELRYDEQGGRWHWGDPDWDEFWQVVKGQGPKTAERLGLRKHAWDTHAWVRQAFNGSAVA